MCHQKLSRYPKCNKGLGELRCDHKTKQTPILISRQAQFSLLNKFNKKEYKKKFPLLHPIDPLIQFSIFYNTIFFGTCKS